jgi:ABC-type Na+ transport system ATPase subunit NatA
VDRACHYLAVGTGNLINTISPDLVVYGGGVIEAVGQIFLDKILAEVDRYCMPSIRSTVDLKIAELGLGLTADEKAAATADAKSQWEGTIQDGMAYYGITDESTDEERSATQVKVLAELESMGYSLESYTEDAVTFAGYDKLRAHLTKDIAVTDEEIVRVCKLACVHDDIMRLSEGYDTVVGEGGCLLSGGQRQRIALARAFLKDYPVIMLDEATSALDNETQTSICETIRTMRGHKTVVMIAHRLSIVSDFDQIAYLQDGKVLAAGTHEEMLANCPEYRKLYAEDAR